MSIEIIDRYKIIKLKKINKIPPIGGHKSTSIVTSD